MVRMLLAVVCLFTGLSGARGAEPFFLQNGQRIVFLGDSNTFAGLYIAYIEGYLFTRFPDQRFELINLGLPSETISGLSEPDHPYPRPCIHDRLDRALAKTKPDVVVACYGMNDGIYYPFAEERFQKYEKSFYRLMDKVANVGAKIVLLTPAPFDPRPLKDKVQDKSAMKFSWMRPYANYDDVLKNYSDWLVTLRTRGYIVVDAHAAILAFLAGLRQTDSNFRVSNDGIHPSSTGHWPIAQALLLAWSAPAEVDRAEIDLKAKQASHGKVSNLTIDDNAIRFSWESKVPLPTDPSWDARLPRQQRINDVLNQYLLVVRGAPKQRYAIYEVDQKLGEVTREELLVGVDLTHFRDLSTNVRAAGIGRLVRERERQLGLAWLTDVGHNRPDTPKGLPLVQAQERGRQIEEQIRKLAKPAAISLRLEATP